MRLALAFLFALLLSPVHAAAITAYTEDLPPLNFQQGGQLTGYASELLTAMTARAGIPLHQQLLPWARAYTLVQSTPDTLLFSTVRTSEREPLFRWVGPISPRRVYLYRLEKRHDIHLSHRGQLRQWRVGTRFASASQLQLQQLGLPAGTGQDRTAPIAMPPIWQNSSWAGWI